MKKTKKEVKKTSKGSDMVMLSLATQTTKVNEQSSKINHLKDKVKILEGYVKKIFGIWDGIVKTLGAIIAIVCSILVWCVTSNMYYSNGRWAFGVIVVGVIGFVVVWGAVLGLVFLITNALSVDKIID